MNPSVARVSPSATRRLSRSWVNGRAVLPGDRTDAEGAARGIDPGHPLVGGQEVRMIAGVEPRFRRLVPGKAGEAIGDIGRIAGLRHLPVIDDVDPDRDLAADDVDDRLAHQPGRARPCRRLSP